MEDIINKLNKYMHRFMQISDIIDLLAKDNLYLNQGWSKIKVLDIHDILNKWYHKKEELERIKNNLLKLSKQAKKLKSENSINKLSVEVDKFRHILKDFYQAYDYFEDIN